MKKKSSVFKNFVTYFFKKIFLHIAVLCSIFKLEFLHLTLAVVGRVCRSNISLSLNADCSKSKLVESLIFLNCVSPHHIHHPSTDYFYNEISGEYGGL